jgi:glycosyltransferase involved in cell wall biosynthesis
VIIATYNWSSVLPYSIASVLDQTYTDFELLVIGDGCTDDSEEVVRSIHDRRLSWFNLPSNTGHQSGPNNDGVGRANGEVIAYLGHDDLWLPRHLELLIEAIETGARIAHASTLIAAPDHRATPWPPKGWRYTPGAWFPPTTAVHHRGLIDLVGGWRMPCDTGFEEPEVDLWNRMAAAGHLPRWVPRLTSVKLAAAERRNVYLTRPSHEQQYWLQRIQQAPDSEEDLPAACVGFRTRLLLGIRRRIRIRTRLRNIGMLPSLSAEERWRARRTFKGIDDL